MNAPRQLVWRLLTDFEGYRAWNPYIIRASGEARNGAELELQLDPLHEDPQDATCDVITVKELRKLYWRCRDHHVPGLLDREHTFRVLPVDAETSGSSTTAAGRGSSCRSSGSTIGSRATGGWWMRSSCVPNDRASSTRERRVETARMASGGDK